MRRYSLRSSSGRDTRRTLWGNGCARLSPPGLHPTRSLESHALESRALRLLVQHLGLCDERYTPTFRGFDSFTGYLLGAEDYYYHNRSDSGFSGLDLRRSAASGASGRLPPACTSEAGVYSTSVFTQTVQTIVDERNKEAPLFIYMPFQSVHGPLMAPADCIERYPASMDKERRTYAGMVSALDDAVLRIERTFTTAGIWNQTLLVFTTDNGGPLGSANNFPLRGHKSTAWEGGVRGVAFVRGTHDPVLDALGFRVPPHSRTLELMHSTDWLPTLAEALDLTPSSPFPLDGFSQWGVLTRGEPTTRTMIIHNCPAAGAGKRGGAIRAGPMKLLFMSSEMQVPNGTAQTPPPGFNGTELNCPVPPPINGEWLFDVVNDPRECINLAAEHPPSRQRLVKLFDEYRRTAVADLALSHGVTDPQADPKKREDGAWGPWSARSDKCLWGGQAT
jgi:arylsulfatase B